MITKLRIRNFKSLRDVTVDLDPLTILIGSSGSGKTNFVEAIRFLRDLLTGGHEFLRRKTAEPSWLAQTLYARADRTEAMEIEVCFQVPHTEQPMRYQISLGAAKAKSHWGLLEECLFEGEELVFQWRRSPDRPELTWVKEPKLRDAPALMEDRLPMLGSLPALDSAVLAHTALSRSIGCHDFPGSVLQKPGKPTDADGLDDDGANYLGVMRQIFANLSDLQAKKRMVAALREISPNVASIELNDVRNPTNVVVSHEFGEAGRLGLLLSQESEGIRRFYAHLLALNQIPSKQTLIFEEPEKGIYPRALEVLAGEFSRCVESGRSQVILTTHSPELLNHLPIENLRVVQFEGTATTITHLAREQAAALGEKLLVPGELLTVDPARGESSPPAAA